MKYIKFISIFLLLDSVGAGEIHFADSHGPISIMGDHIHKKNEVMFSYRFSSMEMNKNLNGTKNLNLNEIMNVPNGASDNSGMYMNAPVYMAMNMHMFGMMYAPSNTYTLMLMSGLIEKKMIQQRMAMSGGGRFQVNSTGISDTRLTGLFKVVDRGKFKTHVGLGLSLPSGSIDERDRTPSSANTRLGYGMQNGTGSYELISFLNNVTNFDKFKFGQQFLLKYNISGKNSNGYKYGDFFETSLWTSYRIFKNLSSSLKFKYINQDKMVGQDNEMNPTMSPVFDSYNIGHQKINVGIGINFIKHTSYFKNNRLAIELIIPVYQKYKGIQMADTYKVVFGWQYGF